MRIGTRASALALAQTRMVAAAIQDAGILTVDQLRSEHADSLSPAGNRSARPAATDKTRWVATLEQALRDQSIDLAVHSAKDLPGQPSPGLAIHGTPRRGPCEDVLILREQPAGPAGQSGSAGALDALPEGARVGTSSLRRSAQILAVRPDLRVLALEGNIDTRLARLSDPERGLDAIVLAAAGLERLGIGGLSVLRLDPDSFVPAPGQGTLALQGRLGDGAAEAAAAALDDRATQICLRAERALAESLKASCNTPLGALARLREGPSAAEEQLQLIGWIGLPDGSAWLRDELCGCAAHPGALGGELAERMQKAGAAELLAEAESMVLAGV